MHSLSAPTTPRAGPQDEKAMEPEYPEIRPAKPGARARSKSLSDLPGKDRLARLPVVVTRYMRTFACVKSGVSLGTTSQQNYQDMNDDEAFGKRTLEHLTRIVAQLDDSSQKQYVRSGWPDQTALKNMAVSSSTQADTAVRAVGRLRDSKLLRDVARSPGTHPDARRAAIASPHLDCADLRDLAEMPWSKHYARAFRANPNYGWRVALELLANDADVGTACGGLSKDDRLNIAERVSADDSFDQQSVLQELEKLDTL